MKIHVEKLNHCTCDHCQFSWVISDREIEIGVDLPCANPGCGKKSTVEESQEHPLEPIKADGNHAQSNRLTPFEFAQIAHNSGLNQTQIWAIAKDLGL